MGGTEDDQRYKRVSLRMSEQDEERDDDDDDAELTPAFLPPEVEWLRLQQVDLQR